MRSSRPLAPAGWARSIARVIRSFGRDVAIKVLAESFIADTERVARFRREAQILAALNHAHIASIYRLEEGAGGQFLVMELVEGGTLAERIAHGGRVPRLVGRSLGEGGSGPAEGVGSASQGLPISEALGIARQVAEALQVAHEKGIVHRDLKPANIAISAEGQVKVLDFGLAKVNGPNGPNDPNAFTSSPTLTVAATQAGVILGTAAYMSPEQARGKPADRRSDIWAFGCVLYEMLSGKRAFQGEDISETLAFATNEGSRLDVVAGECAGLCPRIADALHGARSAAPRG